MNHLVGALAFFTVGAMAVVGIVFFLRRDQASKSQSASDAAATGGPSTTLTCGNKTSNPTEQPEKALG